MANWGQTLVKWSDGGPLLELHLLTRGPSKMATISQYNFNLGHYWKHVEKSSCPLAELYPFVLTSIQHGRHQ